MLGSGGVAGLVMLRPSVRKAKAETSLLFQQAAKEAVGTIQEAAEETRRELKEARDENKGLKAEIVQLREELLQARVEVEGLRNAASAERQQLLEQLSSERAQHEAAMVALRKELSAAQVRRLSNGIGTVLGEFGEGFRDASGL